MSWGRRLAVLIVMSVISLALLGPAEAYVSFESSGDPAKGYDFLVNDDYVGCGIPYGLMERTVRRFGPRDPLNLRHLILPLLAENPFVDPEIPGRTGLNSNLIYSMSAFNTTRGNPVVTFNCLACHAGQIGNQVIVGLGNAMIDFTQDLRVPTNGVGALTKGAGEKAEYRRFREMIRAVGPYIKPRTVGANPAINLTFSLFAHRDPKTLQWSNRALMPMPPKEVPPVDMPPWWRLKKKKSMFYSGEFSGDVHRIMMLASSLCVESLDDVEKLDDSFKDVEAYIRSLEPPKYPLEIQQELAVQGRKVFETSCAKCHGTYGPGGSYPEKIVPIEIIGTDPALMVQENGPGSKRFRDWIDASYYGQKSERHENMGYLAPPLDGIWATAPFFHNGSVPTLEGVLDSSQRPRIWYRTSNPQDYDVENIGLRYRSFRRVGAREREFFERRHIYDTTLPGYSNEGHTFGDSLSSSDRGAVIEYLKTL